MCKQKGQDCTVREWQVLDLYRNTYPEIRDTVCNLDFLFNGINLPRWTFDSIYSSSRKSNPYFSNSVGIFEVLASKDVDFDGTKYQCARVRFLRTGYNIDQEFLFWVGNYEVFIQQMNEDKKLYLLKSTLVRGVSSNKKQLVEMIMKDELLFPPTPELR
jgi:hypothetical protein